MNSLHDIVSSEVGNVIGWVRQGSCVRGGENFPRRCSVVPYTISAAVDAILYVFLEDGANSKENEWQLGHPSIDGLRLCFESSFELSMETFNHAVGLRVACFSAGSSGSEECHKRIPHLRFELATTVGDNSGRYTKARNPATKESMSHNFIIALTSGLKDVLATMS